MNHLHYPDIERCKKLTALGFPVQRWGRLMARAQTPENGRGENWYEPSVMEMLDVIPKDIPNDNSFHMYRTNEREYVAGYMYLDYKLDDKWMIPFGGTLPNALADLIFWLVENKYISFTK